MKNIKRFLHIARSSIKIWKAVREVEKKGRRIEEIGPRINSILTELGPTFIKLGQMLSLRPDLIPGDFADALRPLLDHGMSTDPSAIEQIFLEEFNKPAAEIFTHFESQPFAVASFAEVHQAEYKGKKVAVKIQKPGIKKLIDQDLVFAKRALRVLSIHPKVRKARILLDTIITEFFSWMDHELNYRLEALSMVRIKKNFSKVSYFVVPEVYHEVSTKRILTMEYIEGVSFNEIFNEVPDLARKKIIIYKNITFNKDTFTKRMIQIIFKQVFEDGYFHADPHPANIFLTTEGKIAYIDFGIIGVLTPQLQKMLLSVLASIITRDVEKIASSLIELDEIQGHDSLQEVEAKIRKFIVNWQTGSVLEMSLAEVFSRLINIALESKIDLPQSFVVIGKTILEYDGDLRRCDPELDLVEELRPHIEKVYRIKDFTNYAPAFTIKELLKEIGKLPKEAGRLVHQLADDGIEFTVRLGPITKAVASSKVDE